MQDMIEQYNKRVLKWRKKAIKAEAECDALRRQVYALQRILYDKGL